MDLVTEYLKLLDDWRSSFGSYEVDGSQKVSAHKIDEVFTELTNRLQGNYPFHHPQYAGQMLKPPHPLAWAAYTLAMTINPNNHALDGGPPTSEMEKEVVASISKMIGYGDKYLGHLTSSGTIANIEALWVARSIHPDKAVAYSSAAHYTHNRMCQVLGIKGVEIPVNEKGTMDVQALKDSDENIGTVVVTMGTTGLGLVEALDEILPYCHENGIRVHIDAAYGGFYSLLSGTGIIDATPWQYMVQSDSLVVDPHKHGLQPYGCGCVIFHDPGVGKFYKHDSPYTYFSSKDLHLGEISLECSRPGASAAALWTTLKLFPLKADEGLGVILQQCRRAAIDFFKLLNNSKKFKMLIEPDLDIIAYFPVGFPLSSAKISEVSRKIFEMGMADKIEGVHLSLYRIPTAFLVNHHPDIEQNSDEAVVLRSVLMKPEHRAFAPELMRRLEKLWDKAVF